jgi:hypothetical protein
LHISPFGPGSNPDDGDSATATFQSSCFVCRDEEVFPVSVLSDIERNLCDGKRRKTLRGIYIHLDNALAHNVKRSQQEISRTQATSVVHPVYFPDAALSDFFLFAYLKDEMAGVTANSPADILSDIHRIFQEIS